MFDKDMTARQYQVALDILDALIERGYDINEYINDKPLDEADDYTALGSACRDLNVSAVRALLSRGAQPELSRAEALYNVIYNDTSTVRTARAAARIGLMLLQAGLNPRLLRPSQTKQLFGIDPEADVAQTYRGLTVYLLTLPGPVRRRLPGLEKYRIIMDQAENMLQRLIGTNLTHYLLAGI